MCLFIITHIDWRGAWNAPRPSYLKGYMRKRSFELRFEKETKGIQGYAFKFFEQVDYFGQAEKFAPDMEFTLNESGCFLFRNHDPSKPLARVPDTLNFSLDKEGLRFSAKELNTELWRESKELIDKKVLTGMSIGFSDLKSRMESDVLIYERIKIFEVSLVTWPVYSSSEVSSRENKTLKNMILPPECYE